MYFTPLCKAPHTFTSAVMLVVHVDCQHYYLVCCFLFVLVEYDFHLIADDAFCMDEDPVQEPSE